MLCRLLLSRCCPEAQLAKAANGRLPLHDAAASGSWLAVAVLVDDLKRRTAEAARAGPLTAVPLLTQALSWTDCLGHTPLRIAAERGDGESVAVLVAARAAAAKPAELAMTASVDPASLREAVTAELFRPSDSVPLLCAAARSGAAAGVRALLALCPPERRQALLARCEKTGADALSLAARAGREECVLALLEPRAEDTGQPLALRAWLDREGGRDGDRSECGGLCEPRGGRLGCSPLCRLVKEWPEPTKDAITPLLVAGFSPLETLRSRREEDARIPDSHTPLAHCFGRKRRLGIIWAAARASDRTQRESRAHHAATRARLTRSLRDQEHLLSSLCGESERCALAGFREAVVDLKRHLAICGAAGYAAGEASPPEAKRLCAQQRAGETGRAEAARELRRLVAAASARRAALCEAWGQLAAAAAGVVAARERLPAASLVRAREAQRLANHGEAMSSALEVAMAGVRTRRLQRQLQADSDSDADADRDDDDDDDNASSDEDYDSGLEARVRLCCAFFLLVFLRCACCSALRHWCDSCLLFRSEPLPFVELTLTNF